MPDSPFDKDADIQNILHLIQGYCERMIATDDAIATENLSTVLGATFGMKRPARLYIAGKLDEEFRSILDDWSYDIDVERGKILEWRAEIAALEEARKQGSTPLPQLSSPVEAAKVAILISGFIVKVKGAEASPVARLYTEELAQHSLTTDSLLEECGKAFCNAMENIRRWPEIQAHRLAKKRLEKLKAHRPAIMLKKPLGRL